MATSADVTRLMNNVRMSVPGAIDGALQLAMFSVMNEFFQKSKIWTEDIDFDTVVGETEYEDIVPDFSAVIDTLMGIVNDNDTPVAATMATPGTIILKTEPTVVETLTASVALTVVDPVDREGYPVFPAWILTKYSLTIEHGVLSALMLQPAKPYTNQQLAIYHGRLFQGGIAMARVDARHKNLYGAQRWVFPQFACGRRQR